MILQQKDKVNTKLHNTVESWLRKDCEGKLLSIVVESLDVGESKEGGGDLILWGASSPFPSEIRILCHVWRIFLMC